MAAIGLASRAVGTLAAGSRVVAAHQRGREWAASIHQIMVTPRPEQSLLQPQAHHRGKLDTDVTNTLELGATSSVGKGLVGTSSSPDLSNTGSAPGIPRSISMLLQQSRLQLRRGSSSALLEYKPAKSGAAGLP